MALVQPDPPTTPGPIGDVPITDLQAGLVNNPTLAPGSQMAPVQQEVQQNELLDTPGLQGNLDADKTGLTPDAPQAQQANPNATAQEVNQQAFDQQVAQYDATKVEADTPQAQAATDSAVEPNSLVSERMATLLDVPAGQVPTWARGAVREAEARMGGRGLSNSSMAAQAITAAILDATLPIAQQEAATYEKLQHANLSNRQQTAMANLDARMKALLSDQSADNAAKQFNAQSENQVDTFMQNLRKDIAVDNAKRADTITQFNAAQANQLAAQNAGIQADVEKANAERMSVLERFNSELRNAREQFNVQNQQVIDQSNVQWRRQINTANTASENAANQMNVQNLFNMSQQALANLWQQFRDEASWAEDSAENERNRAHNLAIAALQRDAHFELNDEATKQSLFELIGEFALNVVGEVA